MLASRSQTRHAKQHTHLKESGPYRDKLRFIEQRPELCQRGFCDKVFFLSHLDPSLSPSRTTMKDKILCFACAVKNIETTFNTYYELQDHLYRDHDMKKDPAMDIFNKYKTSTSQEPVAASKS
jgi:hypothetical protein